MTDLAHDPVHDAELDELEHYRAAFAAIREVCHRASDGDLEARVPALDGTSEIGAARHSLNHLLDMVDAFVREAGASLRAAGEGRFHRVLLVHGLHGSFRQGAQTVNDARLEIQASARRLAEAEGQRMRLAGEFEREVLSATEQVASASVELGATASALISSAQASVAEAEQARGTIHQLGESTDRIQRVATLINQVAAQTRLLALNATIEAARAGDAGRGFAVVAHEVKELAGQTAQATQRIEQEIAAVQAAASQSSAVLEGIASTVRDMHSQVIGVAAAVDGRNDDHVDMTGLAQLAELLRGEVTSFLDALRR